MTDQEKLNFKDKYVDNPVAFCEEVLGIKLLSYQKLFLKALNAKDKTLNYFNPFRHKKQFLLDMQLSYLKEMEANFKLWHKDGIDVYEKGNLIKTIKNEN